MEALIAKLLTALGTEEMFRVPGLVKGCDTFLLWNKKNNVKEVNDKRNHVEIIL